MTIDPAVVISLITVAAAGGAAFSGVKVGLNGTRAMQGRTNERIDNLDRKVELHISQETKDHAQIIDRLARIENEIGR
jgi:hypothetical protein